ncbi:MAG: sulfotransferase [Candidatus Omnitrophota bacterium]|nr:sulfotransferase [Candidatus Omnitrophota bacterium]
MPHNQAVRRRESEGTSCAHAGASRPVFIVGCQRSGTTLLRAMLNAHPRIAIPYEAHQFSKMLSTEHPWNATWTRDQVTRPIEEFLSHPKPSQWGLTPAAVQQELRPVDTFRFSDILRAIYAAYARKEGKPRWGDKTPSNTFELPYLLREFPEAQFVHIVRDGRDVFLSWCKVDWARYDVVQAAKRWRHWVHEAYELGETLGSAQYLQLRYEDLVRDPRGHLHTICRFLGEFFDERMLTYHKECNLVPEPRRQFHQLLSSPPDASRTYTWMRQMPRADVKRFERIAGLTLIKYGYPVSLATRVRGRLATVRALTTQVNGARDTKPVTMRPPQRSRVLTSAFRPLPDFIIVGAQKAGTTSLYNMLKAHPSILPAAQKEIFFFDLQYHRGLGWYRAYFPLWWTKWTTAQNHGSPTLTGEATPDYLFHPHVPQRLCRTIPNAKLIILLRNPVDRAYSHYQHQVRAGREPLSFEAAIDVEPQRLAGEWDKLAADARYDSVPLRWYAYCARGRYLDYLQRFEACFPRERILILGSEEFYADPVRVVQDVMAFLELPSWKPDRPRKDNTSGGYPPIAPSLRARLVEYFKPHNRQLYQHLGRTFSWDR